MYKRQTVVVVVLQTAPPVLAVESMVVVIITSSSLFQQNPRGSKTRQTVAKERKRERESEILFIQFIHFFFEAKLLFRVYYDTLNFNGFLRFGKSNMAHH